MNEVLLNCPNLIKAVGITK